MIRVGPRHVGQASGSTSKICCRSAAHRRLATGPRAREAPVVRARSSPRPARMTARPARPSARAVAASCARAAHRLERLGKEAEPGCPRSRHAARPAQTVAVAPRSSG